MTEIFELKKALGSRRVGDANLCNLLQKESQKEND